MTVEPIYSWNRPAGGARDILLMVCAPLLLAGWLVLSAWCVLSLGGLAALSAPSASVAERTTDPGAGHVLISIGAVEFPCGAHR